MKKHILTLALALVALPALAQTGGWTVMGTPTFLQQIQGPQVLTGLGSSNYLLFDDPVLGKPIPTYTLSNWVTFHYTEATNYPLDWQYLVYTMLQSDDGLSWNFGGQESHGTNVSQVDWTYSTTYPNYPGLGSNTPNPMVSSIGIKPQYYTVLLGTYTNSGAYSNYGTVPPDFTFWYNTNCYGCTTPSTNSGEVVWISTNMSTSMTPYGIAVDPANNPVVVGSFYGTLNYLGTNTTSIGTAAFIEKRNSSGATLWGKVIEGSGTSGDEAATAVAIDSSSNIVIVGNFESKYLDVGAGVMTNFGYKDSFIAKFDPNGACLWSTNLGGPYYDEGWGVALDGSGNIYVVGAFNGTARFGAISLTSAGNWDIYICKLSSSGNVQWAVRHGTAVNETAKGVSIDASGNVLICGYWTAGSTDLGGGMITNAGAADAFVAKYSGVDGSYIWARALAGSGADYAFAVTTDTNNQVFVVGQFGSDADFGGGSRSTISGGGSFVASYTSGNGYLWDKYTGGSGDYAKSVAADSNGHIVVTGLAGGMINWGTWPASPHLYGPDSYTVQFAISGTNAPTMEWTKYYPAMYSCVSLGSGIVYDSAGRIDAVGSIIGSVDLGTGSIHPGGSVPFEYVVQYWK